MKMTRWLAWFRAAKNLAPVFRLIAASDLDTAEMVAEELAKRDKVSLIGVTVAPENFNTMEESPKG